MLPDSEKPHVSIVIVGHVDAGKSTFTGRLLFDLGSLDPRELDKLEKEAIANGKESFKYAYVMDNTKAERERGVTIKQTVKEFFTKGTTKNPDGKHFTIIDAPGHRDYVRNMISGSSQADAALLLVPADSFEQAIRKEDPALKQVEGQTRQHAQLCYLLGIKQMIIGVNKMDSVGYKEDRFNEIKNEVSNMVSKVGYGKAIKDIPIIPFAAMPSKDAPEGDNLSSVSSNMPWFKGCDVEVGGDKIHVHTIIEALDDVVQIPKRPSDKVVRVSVSDTIRSIPGCPAIVTGRLEQGTLKAGQNVRFALSGSGGKAFSIEMHHRDEKVATAGENIGVNTKGLPKGFYPKRGDVMYVDDPNDPSPVGKLKSFVVQMQVLDHPGKLKQSVEGGRGGWCPVGHCKTGTAACQLKDIRWRMGKKTTGGQKVTGADVTFIEKGDACECEFVCQKPFWCEPFKHSEAYGRVAFMDSNRCVAIGKVISTEIEKWDPVK